MPHTDTLLKGSLKLCALTTSSIVLVMFGYLLIESRGALSQITWHRFITDASWHPTENLFDMSPMILGTLLSTAGAVLVATPIGISVALFCRFVAPAPMVKILRRIIELMAGIPSVVYGFWGLVMLVPWVMMIEPPGASLLSGIIVLSMMILPTITLISEASFAHVPKDMLQGASALGLSRVTTIKNIVLPLAKSGILTGIILATGRAVGETMAILMVCGNVVQVPDSLFAPIRTLTANIALEMAYAMDLHRSSLFVSGLFLTLVAVLLVLLASLVRKKANA